MDGSLESRRERSAMMRNDMTSGPTVPRWLRFVMVSDRTGSSWYVGTGFFFAPLLAVVSPWPTLTTALWVLIALAGLWLGILGIAMATGLGLVLRAGGGKTRGHLLGVS